MTHFRRTLTRITNSVKPTLDDINAKFFEDAERYQILKEKFDKRNPGKSDKGGTPSVKATSSHAANVHYSKENAFKPCSLCAYLDKKDASHPIFKCDRFENADPKVNKIISLQGCSKCSNLNHSSENCKFRFNAKCKHCKGWYFSFLCVEKSGESKDKLPGASKSEDTKDKPKPSKAPPKQERSLLAVVEALGSSPQSESSILPTFLARKIRVLKDGGCQSNLVADHLVNSLNLKVLDDKVDLRINGINIAQEYKSRLVELELSSGSEKKIVQALSIPSILIDLNLLGLSCIVRSFTEKGYKLADEFLLNSGDHICGIDLILGTKSGYCILDSEIIFGHNGQSVYSQTPCGIMLNGDVDRLLQDVDCLSSLEKVTVEAKVAEISGNSTSEMNIGKLDINFKESSSLTAPLISGPLQVDSNFNVTDKDGHIIMSKLEKAANEVLENSCRYHTQLDNQIYEEENYELTEHLVKFCLDNARRNEEGRLIMTLLWNEKASHLLGKNLKLSRKILQSNFKKLSKNPIYLKLMNNVLKEQEAEGIIERITNLDQYLQENPTCSFLPYMGDFRLGRETTKRRIVFLSNLCERDPTKQQTVSHNQAIHFGPCLNQKLSSALLHLIINKKNYCFDLCKAFN